MRLVTRERHREGLAPDRLDAHVGIGAGLQAAIDDVAWAAGGLADELDAMIARRERCTPAGDPAAQVAAAARLLPRRR